VTFNKAFNRGRVVHNSEVKNWIKKERIAKVTAPNLILINIWLLHVLSELFVMVKVFIVIDIPIGMPVKMCAYLLSILPEITFHP